MFKCIILDVPLALYGLEYLKDSSTLGHLLCSIYINDLKNLGLTGKLYMFADDISLLYQFKYDSVLKTNIERDAAFYEYARLN